MNRTILRLLIGAGAGAGATLALASVIRKFGSVRGSLTGRITPADIARGAAAGAVLGLLDARPGRIVGAMTGGGLWLASELAASDLAIRPARGDAGGAVLLAAHLAWGWTAAQVMTDLSDGLGAD